MKNFLKRIAAVFLAVFLVAPLLPVFADDYILRDDAAGLYTGRATAPALISAARFNDVAAASPLAEVVARGVALGLIQRDGPNFRPNDYMTRAEALAFAMRAAGLSGEATALGTDIAPAAGITGTQAVINLGYRQLAINMGIIPADFPQAGLSTREETAFLLHSAIQAVEELFPADPALTRLYAFNDWRQISPAYLAAVENIVAANVMMGDGAGFNPRGHITRGQMAQVLARLDSILFELNGWERRHGTVARVQDSQYATTGEAFLERDVHVRRGDGSLDILQYRLVQNPSPQVVNLDAVVFNNGQVMGLAGLWEGDTIEFIVETETNTILYVRVTGQAAATAVEGQLYRLDIDGPTITIRDGAGRLFTYSMAEGIISNVGGTN